MAEVARFERCCPGPDRNASGLAQFHAYESRGVRPADPDPYFRRLLDGKKWWEWTVNAIAETYLTDDWWGWAQFEQDYAGDEAGLKQIRRRVERMRPR